MTYIHPTFAPLSEHVPHLPDLGGVFHLVHHNNSALLFDEDNDGEEDEIATGDNSDDDDLHSLMDRGLEEIDDLLSTKGRLSVFGLPPASSEEETAKTGDHRPSPATGRERPKNGFSVTGEESTTAAARCDGREKPTGDVGRSAPDSTENPHHRSARGTGANAASILMSATAPTGSAGAVGSASFLGPDSTERELGRSFSAVATNGDDKALHSNHHVPDGSREVTRSKEGVRSYVYEAGALRGGGNTDHLYSPPRRRVKETTPFIKAKGLTLTHTQAKLFGLAGSSRPPAGVAKNGLLKQNITWPGSGSQSQPTGGTRRTSLGGNARDSGHRPRRSYSPARLEQLSIPVPGKGRFGESCIGEGRSAERQREGGRSRGGNALFTWKRSRRAEAAMRYAALR